MLNCDDKSELSSMSTTNNLQIARPDAEINLILVKWEDDNAEESILITVGSYVTKLFSIFQHSFFLVHQS